MMTMTYTGCIPISTNSPCPCDQYEGYRYLRGNSEIDLEPLGGGLVLGAPRLVGGLVDSRVLDAAAAVPLRRVVGRRRDLTGANVARRHAERTVVRARCTVIT